MHAMSASVTPSCAGMANGSQGLENQGNLERVLQWRLKRNCSASPHQVLVLYGLMSFVSTAIGLFFWWKGATLVMPFAWIEMLALGAALFVYARHAADNEVIRLQSGRLIVEASHGRRVQRAEFTPGWVRIEPDQGKRSLIELSGQGQTIAIGRFVRPELRRQLADELRRALRADAAWVAPGHQVQTQALN